MIANTKRKALMISAVSNEFPKSLATQEIGNVFTHYRDELEWLANFLTGDKNVSAACVIDACALAEWESPDFQEWLLEWARVGTIRSAVQIQQRRIAQLSSAYMARPCIHRGHAAERSTHEAALMLGVDQCSVEGACCAAIHFLKELGCEQFQGQNEFAGLSN
jgi:hypothetical protein